MTEFTMADLDKDDVFDDAVVPAATRLILLKRELAEWNNTAFLSRRRHNLAKNLGAAPEALKAERDQFEQALQAIEAYKADIAALEQEAQRPQMRAA